MAPDVAVNKDQDTLPRVPWSQVAPSFIRSWGYPGGHFDPEHVEILGPNGSGKTYFEATILQQRVKLRNSAVIFIATKPLDKTIAQLGWPVVSNVRDVRKHRQVIFWPQTKEIGEKRKMFLENRVYNLLAWLWSSGAKVIVSFDEIATAEELSSRMKSLIAMYWREARSTGKTIVAMKQRGQGVQRDMHSEAVWIAAFSPKHEDDGKYVGSVMGSWRKWQPVLSTLDRDRHEFVLLHSRTGQAVISWVDQPLTPIKPAKKGIYRRAGR